jgi:hypothetical protein
MFVCSTESTFVPTSTAVRRGRCPGECGGPPHYGADLNGHRGHKTVEEGGAIIVETANVASDGPIGGFFSDEGPLPW